MNTYYIQKNAINSFYLVLRSEGKIIAPVKNNQHNNLEEISDENSSSINLFGIRSVESFKSWVFKIRETVSEYFGEEKKTEGEKLVFLGMRACDLSALMVQDRVYLEGDFKDPIYEKNRKNLLIITADCTDCGKTCFCNIVNEKPFAEIGYDINISALNDGYILEANSERGNEIIGKVAKLSKAEDQYMIERDNQRNNVSEKLIKQNSKYVIKYELGGIHKINLENKAWKALTKDCVECSACNFACPSCTCFLLEDSKANLNFNRDKVWDACLKAGYARVAGGGNSRPKLSERLQNRYHCKFDYSFDRLQRYTCVGCGRCIDACAGNIDMRKIFAALSYLAPLSAKLE